MSREKIPIKPGFVDLRSILPDDWKSSVLAMDRL